MRYRIRRSVGVHGHGGAAPPGPFDWIGTDLGGSAQIALGFGVLVIGAILLFSSTEAGQLAGRGAMTGARRAARFIPGVGALL